MYIVRQLNPAQEIKNPSLKYLQPLCRSFNQAFLPSLGFVGVPTVVVLAAAEGLELT